MTLIEGETPADSGADRQNLVAVSIVGVAWVLFGMGLWTYRVGSIAALAALIGITMIFNGITEIIIGSRLPAFRVLVVTVGVPSVLAGIWALAWPGPTLYVIAVFLGWLARPLRRPSRDALDVID